MKRSVVGKVQHRSNKTASLSSSRMSSEGTAIGGLDCALGHSLAVSLKGRRQFNMERIIYKSDNRV